jgi:RND family efflux transporter MFP subunit
VGAAFKGIVAAMALAAAAGLTWVQLVRARQLVPRVWTETVERREVEASVTARGRLGWAHARTLSAPADGRVAEVLVRPGQRVHAGEPLVRLDASDARARLEEARAAALAAHSRKASAAAQTRASDAAVLLAEETLTRQERLLVLGLAPLTAFDAADHDARMARLASIVGGERLREAGARVREAEAAVATEARVSAARMVRAPADGIVTDVRIQQGQWVVGGAVHVPPTALVTLASGELVAEVLVGQRDAATLSQGWPAVVVLDADPRRHWPAQLDAVGDGAERAVLLTVRLLERPPFARAGMAATVRFVAARRAGTLAVPNHALVSRPDGDAVWTVSNGVIVPLAVTLGLRGDEYSEVLAGVGPGRLVVTGPHSALRTVRPGDAVSVLR